MQKFGDFYSIHLVTLAAAKIGECPLETRMGKSLRSIREEKETLKKNALALQRQTRVQMEGRSLRSENEVDLRSVRKPPILVTRVRLL